MIIYLFGSILAVVFLLNWVAGQHDEESVEGDESLEAWEYFWGNGSIGSRIVLILAVFVLSWTTVLALIIVECVGIKFKDTL